MKLKKITREDIKKNIDDLNFIDNKLKVALETKEKDLREYVCKKYIILQNVSKVAEVLNEEGERLGNRKFIGKDISNIILNTKDSDIAIVAKSIFEYNNTLQNGKKSTKKLLEMLKKLSDINES